MMGVMMILGKVIDKIEWHPGVNHPDVQLTNQGHFFKDKKIIPGDFILTCRLDPLVQKKFRKPPIMLVLFRVNGGCI